MGDFNALLHEHIHYFTFNGAKKLFSKYGLIISSYIQEHDGAIFHLLRGDYQTNDLSNFSLEVIKYNYNYQLKF